MIKDIVKGDECRELLQNSNNIIDTLNSKVSAMKVKEGVQSKYIKDVTDELNKSNKKANKLKKRNNIKNISIGSLILIIIGILL